MIKKYIIQLKSIQYTEQIIATYSNLIQDKDLADIFYGNLSEDEFNIIKNDNRIRAIHEHVEFSMPSIPAPIIDDQSKMQTYNPNINGDRVRITQSCDGSGVDIIIVDSYLAPDAPELLDNNGNQRFIRYNWNDLYLDVQQNAITVKANPKIPLRPIFTAAAPVPYSNQEFYTITNAEWGTFANYTLTDASLRDGPKQYNYEFSANVDGNYHGTLVASIAAGNTNGWAKSANIYFLRLPTSNDPDISPTYSLWAKYIKAFHRRKLFFAQKNNTVARPTIVNASWGVSNIALNTNIPIDITSIRYRGSLTNTTTSQQVIDRGFLCDNDSVQKGSTLDPNKNQIAINDVIDMIDDGIVLVTAAGNDSGTIDSISNITTRDYNNTINITNGTNTINESTHRGSFPLVQNLNDANAQAIIVGSCDFDDTVSDFSNVGRGVIVFAPGRNIIGQFFPYDNILASQFPNTPDTRRPGYHFISLNGTSFAAPQVAGILACAFSSPNILATTGVTSLATQGHIAARVLLTRPYSTPFVSTLPTNIIDNGNGGRCYIPESLCCNGTSWDEPGIEDIHQWIGPSKLRGGPNRIIFNPYIKFLDILPSPNP